MNDRNLSQIPAAACQMVVGEVEFGDNGEKAKTAPVRLTARSGQPINHWFWGRIVHDLSGMHLHKPRIPIDYSHDAQEVIGYLNRFDSTSGDLIVSGALVPFKDSDRASEIMHKAREGVPYEASINFGGDGIKVQELMQGQVDTVNGYDLEGPAVIVREWPLRGVAICPYGADANTESRVLSNGKQYSATVIKPEPDTDKENAMSNAQSVEAVAPEAVAEESQTPEVELSQPVEETPGEAVAPEAQAAVEPETPEGSEELAAPEVPATPEPVAELSRDDFLKIVAEFGAEIAAQTVKDGGDYTTALTLAYSAAKTEAAELREQVGKLNASRSGRPAPVTAAPNENKKPLFNTGK